MAAAATAPVGLETGADGADSVPSGSDVLLSHFMLIERFPRTEERQRKRFNVALDAWVLEKNWTFSIFVFTNHDLKKIPVSLGLFSLNL